MASRYVTLRPQELLVDGVHVTLTRKRVKNINLRIRRDGSVAVSAPVSVPLTDIEDLIRRRHDWIVASQQHVEEAQKKSRCLCADGAEIVLWGETLAIRLEALATLPQLNS